MPELTLTNDTNIFESFMDDPKGYIEREREEPTTYVERFVCDEHVTMRRVLQLLILTGKISRDDVERAKEVAETFA